jgi:hypothetical protein
MTITARKLETIAVEYQHYSRNNISNKSKVEATAKATLRKLSCMRTNNFLFS